MKRLSYGLALIGLAGSLGLVLWYDVGSVLGTAISVGWQGLAVLVGWQVLTFVLLGLAWSRVVPEWSAAVLVRGRGVRDAATTCLPFSPVGGYVLGARALTLQGMPWPTAAACTVVDVTMELAAQLLFALFGVSVLLFLQPGSALATPILAGSALVAVTATAVILARRHIGAGLRGLGQRLLGQWFPAKGGSYGGLDQLQAELARLAARRAPLTVGLLLHLSGWFITGLGTWISLRLLGWDGAVVPIMALEALLDAVLAAAFLVPAAAGVQEAGYVALGAAFGVTPELALSVSLLRRARDLLLGVPILAVWQWLEVRRLRATP